MGLQSLERRSGAYGRGRVQTIPRVDPPHRARSASRPGDGRQPNRRREGPADGPQRLHRRCSALTTTPVSATSSRHSPPSSQKPHGSTPAKRRTTSSDPSRVGLAVDNELRAGRFGIVVAAQAGAGQRRRRIHRAALRRARQPRRTHHDRRPPPRVQHHDRRRQRQPRTRPHQAGQRTATSCRTSDPPTARSSTGSASPARGCSPTATSSASARPTSASRRPDVTSVAAPVAPTRMRTT